MLRGIETDNNVMCLYKMENGWTLAVRRHGGDIHFPGLTSDECIDLYLEWKDSDSPLIIKENV